ncbi:hypothetical protein ACEPAF_7738 [Sanghuangporus sanghuang]
MPKKKQIRSEAQALALQTAQEQYHLTLSSSRKENIPERSTRRIDQLLEELKKKQEKLTEAQHLTIRQATDLRRLNDEYKEVESTNLFLEQQVEELKRQLTSSTRQLERARATVSARRRQIQDLRAVQQRSWNSKLSLQNENRLFRCQLAEKEKRLTKSETLASKSSNQLAIVNCESIVLSSQLLKAEAQKKEAEKEKETIERNWLKAKQAWQEIEKEKLENLRQKIDSTHQKYHAVYMQLDRVQKRSQRLEIFRKRALKIMRNTLKGAYSTRFRALVRRLVSSKCPLTRCGPVIGEFIKFALELFGIDPSKSKIYIPSVRTIRRIIGEAAVASKVQLAVDLKSTRGFTTGGDGTTNKNQTFESQHFNVDISTEYDGETHIQSSSSSGKHVVRFGNLRLAANHRAETQVQAEVHFMKEIFDLYNESPLAAKGNTQLTLGMAAMKFHGSHGDHAEDQKAKHRLLASWKEETSLCGLGARHFFSMPENERYALVLEGRRQMINDLGGEAVWSSLSAEEQNEKNLALMDNLAMELSKEALDELSDADRREMQIFVWAGCGMHKDLNATKGGDLAMCEEWKKYEISPVLLANRDNAAVLELPEQDEEEESEPREESAAKKRAREISKAGASQHSYLTACLLNDKDDKKGQHHSFRDWYIEKTGRSITYPDVTNTRYSSHLEASAETLAHLDIYLEYVDEQVRFSKEKPGLNHLETNVLKGLQDPPTLTEHACMALYREAVSIPYIQSIRSGSLEDVNALQLGSLLQKVQDHIRKLINSPQIVLSCDNPQSAILNGNEYWNRPDTIKAIQILITDGRLPHLEGLFKAFLSGSLAVWKRFSSEFSEDGMIVELTEQEKDLAWMPTTNDANEGALGSYREFARKNPNGTVQLFNALFRYRRNNTENFIQKVLTGEEEQKFLRKRQREDDVQRPDRKRRKEVVDERRCEAATKKQKYELSESRRKEREERVRRTEVELDCNVIEQMTVARLDQQLAKFKSLYKDLQWIATSSLNKEQKRSLVLSWLEKHEHSLDNSDRDK